MPKAKPYRDSLWSLPEFVERPIPEREWLVSPVIPHPSIGMVYSWRGSGKTFTTMTLGIQIARGQPWMGYQVPKPRGVLLVDGEMPLGDLRARLAGLTMGDVPANLWVLASEDLAVAHRNINLSHAEDRQEITKMLAELPQIEFVVLDNWTSLVRGIDENDNAAMDGIKEWLITLRHGERSILMVHHAGKMGGQRGGSAREDVLDYSASLKLATQSRTESYFQFTWDKMRTGMPDDPQFTMRLNKEPDGRFVLAKVTDGEKRQTKGGGKNTNDDEVVMMLARLGPRNGNELKQALGIQMNKLQVILNRLVALERITRSEEGIYAAAE